MSEITFALFNDKNDTDPKYHTLSIDQFFKEFDLDEDKVVDEPATIDDIRRKQLKTMSVAWSPSRYDGQRAQKNAREASALVFDFDRENDKSEGLRPGTLETILEVTRGLGVAYLVHSSFSSGFYAPRHKIRVIFPLSSAVSQEECGKLWDHYSALMPARPDSQKRLPDGMFFTPKILRDHVHHFFYEADATRPLMDPRVSFTASAFQGVDLNAAFSSRKSEAQLLEEIRQAAPGEKDITRCVAASALGRRYAEMGQPLGTAVAEVWEKLRKALAENTQSKVGSWDDAETKTYRNIKWAYTQFEEQQSDLLKVAEEKQKELIGKVTDKLRRKAQHELEKQLKKVKKTPGLVNAAAYWIGKYVPHVLEEDVVVKALEEVAFHQQKKSVAPFSEIQAKIATGLAKGKADPEGRLEDWRGLLTSDEEGKIAPTDENLFTLLTEHPETLGLMVYDVRQGRIVLSRKPPWECSADSFPAIFDLDAHTPDVAKWACEETGVSTFGFKRVVMTCRMISHRTTWDGFLEYLEASKWDGVPRLDTWLIDICKAEDTLLHRRWGACWVIAACARTFKPGEKVDNVLVFVGVEHLGKSAVFKNLPPVKEYTTDTIPDDKDINKTLNKYLFVELAELSHLDKKSTEKIKHFVTQLGSNTRISFTEEEKDYPRRSVLGGTTNELYGFLTGVDGNRRWWPLKCGKCDIYKLIEIRDQLWAEAWCRFKAGEKWYLTDEEEDLAKEHVKTFARPDEMSDQLMEYWENGIRATLVGNVENKDADIGDLQNVGVRVWAYDGQFEGGKFKFLTTNTVCELFGLDIVKQGHLAITALKRCGFEQIGQTRLKGRKVRPWLPEGVRLP